MYNGMLGSKKRNKAVKNCYQRLAFSCQIQSNSFPNHLLGVQLDLRNCSLLNGSSQLSSHGELRWVVSSHEVTREAVQFCEAFVVKRCRPPSVRRTRNCSCDRKTSMKRRSPQNFNSQEKLMTRSLFSRPPEARDWKRENRLPRSLTRCLLAISGRSSAPLCLVALTAALEAPSLWKIVPFEK